MASEDSAQPPLNLGGQLPEAGPDDVTTATYDSIAAIYYEKWHDRSAIEQHLQRFVDMLRAYGLSSLPVLDLGCGPGFDAAFFRGADLHTIGLDLSTSMMKAGRPEFGGEYVQADMRHLPVAIVGGLWVSASMLHITRDQAPAVLRGFADALAPGGLLYLSLKAGHGAEWTQVSHGQPLPRYFVYWQPGELDMVLKAAGFEVVDGWLSPVSETTSWLIRFARKTSKGNKVPLALG